MQDLITGRIVHCPELCLQENCQQLLRQVEVGRAGYIGCTCVNRSLSIQRVRKRWLGLNCNRNFRTANTGRDEPRIERKVKSVCTEKDLGLQVKKRACQKLREGAK